MSWFDEDPELLRAALEIIESWDGESSVNGVPVASSSPTTEETDSTNDENDGEAGSEDGSEDTRDASSHSSSPPPASRARTATTAVRGKRGPDGAPRELKPSTVSSTRHKRREEIIYLRDKVKDMETQLATLQKQKVDGDDSTASVMNGVDAALAVMWQDIAGRQQRLRQKAEFEQAKLRGLLETQMKVARGLIKLMQKARRIEEDESFPTAKRAKLPIDVSLGVSEEKQYAHIEDIYSRIGDAFTFSKFHDGTLKFIDVEVLDREEDEVVIEFRDAWALPFEIDEVMNAMWTFMSNKTDHGDCKESMRKFIKVNDDMFTTHFSGTSSMGSLKGTFDGKAITKRFREAGEHGPAIVTTMYAEPHFGSGEQLHGIRMQEEGWLRIVSARSLTGQTDGRTLSVVQSNRHFRLSFDLATAPSSRRNAGMLTDFLLDQLTQEIQFKHETVETLLLHSRSQ